MLARLGSYPYVWKGIHTSKLLPKIGRAERVLLAENLPLAGYLGQGVLHDRNPLGQSINLPEPFLVCLEGSRVRLYPAEMRSGVRFFRCMHCGSKVR